jgi:hypothetical protein
MPIVLIPNNQKNKILDSFEKKRLYLHSRTYAELNPYDSELAIGSDYYILKCVAFTYFAIQ